MLLRLIFSNNCRMSHSPIDVLTDQLRELHIQRENMLREERRIAQEIEAAFAAHQPSQEARTGRVTPPPQPRTAPAPGEFHVGQHVFIEDRIRHAPFGRRANPGDRAAVVQQVTADRVCTNTCNGHSTWRHRDNLRHLTEQEQRDIRGRQRLQTRHGRFRKAQL